MRTRTRHQMRLYCLGTVDLRTADGQPVRALLAQPRRFALLVYLVLAPVAGSVRRTTVATMFWPEADEPHARGALRQALRFIRATAGADVVQSPNADEIAVDADAFWSDVGAFEDAFAVGDADTAVALYRGDLLDGFYVDDAPGFDEWLERRRARLARAYTAALEQLAVSYAANGRSAAAIECWRSLLARAPESGRAALGLMRALDAAGYRTAALDVAARQESLLAREYRTAVDPEVRALAEQLRTRR